LWGVNGSQRGPFDDRVPFLAATIAALLSYHFLRQGASARVAGRIVIGAFVAGAFAVVVLPPPRAAAFAAPIVILAIASLAWGLYRSARKHGAEHRRAAAHLVLLLAGVLGLVVWASPPTYLTLGTARVPVAAWAVPFGLIASLSAFIAAHLSLRSSARRALLATGAVAIFSYGYNAGSLLAATGLILALSCRTPTAANHLRENLRLTLYRTSLHLLHAGVVLGMLGFGMSTYYAQDHSFTTENPLSLGEPTAMGVYTATFERSQGVDADEDGVYENVDAYITFGRPGQDAATVVLSMYFEASKDHYDPSTHVERGALEDLYVNANFQNAHAMYSETDGWVRGHGPTTEVRSAEITKLAMDVRIIPHVNLLWAGIALSLAAMATRLATRPKTPIYDSGSSCRVPSAPKIWSHIEP
jgi:hypothetical protein